MLKPVLAQANQRPLSDFIDAQGTTACFTPPAPAQFGFSSDSDKPPVRFGLIDYTGLTAKYLLNFGINLGTTVSGTVLERPLPDGRALVTVNTHTKNALGWAIAFDPNGPVTQFNSNPLLFGYRAQELIAQPGLTPALGDFHFHVEFTNTAPGRPLPDLVCVNASQDCPNVAPCPAGFQLDLLSEDASVTGPLHLLAGLGPEGTQGRLVVVQTGLLNPDRKHNGKGVLDQFPAETVDLHAIGK
jgi:hypothetical protein